MSISSSYRSCDSEDDSSTWLSSEGSINDEDELSDELTLLNGDEDNSEDAAAFEAFIKLSIRLKKEYNIREASVALERCDKIWDTMQVLKCAQSNYKDGEEEDEEEEEEEDDEEEEEEEESNNENTDCEEESESSKSLNLPITSGVTNNTAAYIKYQPMQGNGNNALPNFYLSVKSQKKVYNCATCGKLYSEKRALRTHVEKYHGITLPLLHRPRKYSKNTERRTTRSRNPQSNDSDSKDLDKEKSSKESSTGSSLSSFKDSDFVAHLCPKCPCSYSRKSNLKKHAMDVHNFEIVSNNKRRGRPPKKDKSMRTRNPENKGKNNNEILYHYCRMGSQGSKSYNYKYLCIKCGEWFTKKFPLLEHIAHEHDISIPMTERTYGLNVSRNELLQENYKPASTFVHEGSKNDSSEELPVRQRAGPKSSKVTERPKRACAINTSYTEPTKEDEESLLHEILSSECTTTDKASSSQTTKCFLCKNSFVDIKRHLKDYHRISSPDSVLPLKEKLENTKVPKPVEKLVKNDSTEEKSRPSRDSIFKRDSSGTRDEERPDGFSGSDKIFKGLWKRVEDKEKGRDFVQCLICKYNYSNYSGVKRHLQAKIKNGVVQDHIAFTPNGPRSRHKPRISTKNIISDPLALTNMSERSDEVTSDENDNSRKRRTSFSDDSSSISDDVTGKRRKIENMENNEIGRDRTGGNSCYEEDEEEDEEKMNNQRDTRDSSDRDSGIGISITIKKRNNSYEVVDKDNYYCEEDKTKNNNNIKDDNVASSSDPSSSRTKEDFHNEKELIDSRRPQIFNVSDNEECNKFLTTTIAKNSEEDEDVVIIDNTDIIARRKDMTKDTFDCKKDLYSEEAFGYMSGKVPSLKVLCRNVLKRDEVSNVMENDKNSHQCPVCCRFYPTERDVTIHMLEHKVRFFEI